jgi:hypothetical protein
MTHVDSLLIAHDGQADINGFATKLGDTICAIISARAWVKQYAPKNVMLTLCRDHKWNVLWSKFIADYSVDVIYSDPDPNSGAKYARFDSIRAARAIDGKKFDVYRELYARLDGGGRQTALCHHERGLGRAHIFEYYHWGQEDPIIPEIDWSIDTTVLYTPAIPREPQVLIAPVAFSQGNNVFNAAFWHAVYDEIKRCGISVAWNTDVAPDGLSAHIAKNSLICCGNTGIGWMAAVTGTPFIACEPHDSQLYDYRYELFKPPALVDVIDEPDPHRLVAAVRAALHFITPTTYNPALNVLRANEAARRNDPPPTASPAVNEGAVGNKLNPRVALVTSVSSNIIDVATLTMPNKLEYCLQHGYSLIADNQPYDIALENIDLLRHYLDRFDLIVTIDADAIITNMTLPVHELACLGPHVTVCEEGIVNFNRLNCGVMVWRNTEQTRELIHTIAKTHAEWRSMPCGFQTWLALMADKLADVLTIAPVRAFNSCVWNRPSNAYDEIGGNWQPGDFIYHPCGVFPRDERLRWLTSALENVKK